MENLPQGYDSDSVVQMETNLDDLAPEILAFACEQLRNAGALDVWITPIQMKKHRPGQTLSVLCKSEHVETLTDILFRETGAFGLRIQHVTRLKLRRDFIEVQTAFGPVTVKRGFRGGQLLALAPEFESCRSLAEKHSVPIQHIYDAAKAAASIAKNLSPPTS